METRERRLAERRLEENETASRRLAAAIARADAVEARLTACELALVGMRGEVVRLFTLNKRERDVLVGQLGEQKTRADAAEARVTAMEEVVRKTDEALINRLFHQLARSKMGYSDLFESDAEAFYAKTGLLAPGKSLPLEMASDEYEDRRNAAWRRWQDEQRERWRSDVGKVIEALSALRALLPKKDERT